METVYPNEHFKIKKLKNPQEISIEEQKGGVEKNFGDHMTDLASNFH